MRWYGRRSVAPAARGGGTRWTASDCVRRCLCLPAAARSLRRVNLTRVWTAFAVGVALLLAGCALWIAHATARNLAGGADVLGYDPAQYAVAARELAEHGRLATPFALPVELAKDVRPPWPLALVQPGLVLADAALFKALGATPPARAGQLVLVWPLVAYLATAIVLAFATASLVARAAPGAGETDASLAALVVGLAFLLDPEAQHYATGGFTELPFTFGLAVALAALARGPRLPAFAFGLVLGATGLFRGNMLWLAPAFALAYAWASQRGVRAFALALAGYAAVLAPWWLYKWSEFGNPAWDLSRLALWDGVDGRTWFSLNHLPQLPDVPTGSAAALALESKLARNTVMLAAEIASGPRALWLAGLVAAAFGLAARGGPAPVETVQVEREDLGRGARAAALAALLAVALTVGVAALSVPLFRYLLPARLVAEAAGLVAVWAFVWNLPAEWLSATARRVVCLALAVLALAWGTWQSGTGLAETARVAADRGLPSRTTLEELSRLLDAELRPDEPVMSNLGPTLAWYTRRPVLHLALTPADIEKCRERLPFDEVVLAFRESARAWPGWEDVVARPNEAQHDRDWNIRRVRAWTVRDGFDIVWLELGPPRTPMATR